MLRKKKRFFSFLLYPFHTMPTNQQTESSLESINSAVHKKGVRVAFFASAEWRCVLRTWFSPSYLLFFLATSLAVEYIFLALAVAAENLIRRFRPRKRRWSSLNAWPAMLRRPLVKYCHFFNVSWRPWKWQQSRIKNTVHALTFLF